MIMFPVRLVHGGWWNRSNTGSVDLSRHKCTCMLSRNVCVWENTPLLSYRYGSFRLVSGDAGLKLSGLIWAVWLMRCLFIKREPREGTRDESCLHRPPSANERLGQKPHDAEKTTTHFSLRAFSVLPPSSHQHDLCSCQTRITKWWRPSLTDHHVITEPHFLLIIVTLAA